MRVVSPLRTLFWNLLVDKKGKVNREIWPIQNLTYRPMLYLHVTFLTWWRRDDPSSFPFQWLITSLSYDVLDEKKYCRLETKKMWNWVSHSIHLWMASGTMDFFLAIYLILFPVVYSLSLKSIRLYVWNIDICT